MLKISETLGLPNDAIGQTFGILAMRGAGKTNAARVLAEEMFRAKLPFVAVDPVGSWWGLRSSRDGNGPGLPVPIFGGRHGDVPLERSGGQLIADLVVDERLSCVLDLTGFDSEGGKKAFLLDFARRLYLKNEAPLHLFLEEADDYIPQRPMRDEAQLLRAWENIVRRGRARGLGITLITQRSASINKNVLTQIETLIALRTTSPQDRSVVEDWLKYHAQSKDVAASLAELKNGEAWLWSPQWLGKTERIRFRLSDTYDSGATPKMQAGRTPATLADVDLDAVASKMAATIERAKAEDPKELRRRIAELERELKAKPVPVAPTIERVEVDVVTPANLAKLQDEIDRGLEAGANIMVAAKVIADAIARAEKAPVIRAQPTAATSTRPDLPVSIRAPRTNSGTITPRQQRFLNAAASLARLDAEVTRNTVAAWVGVHPRGGSVGEELSALVEAGLIYLNHGHITVTELGFNSAEFEGPEDAIEAAKSGLTNRQRKFFGHIEAAYPGTISREAIASLENIHPRGGSLGEDLGRLVGRGLVERDRSVYRMRDFLAVGQR